MKKDDFKQFIKSIILEVRKTKQEDEDSKPNNVDGSECKYKRTVDGEFKDTAAKLVKQIERIVKKIDSNATAILDDHNDVTAILPGEFKIRISPKGAGLFDVEAFRNMSDRIYAIALTQKQVLDFVKINFSTKKTGYVQTAYDKSMSNLKSDADKKSKKLPKGELVKEKEVNDKDIDDTDAKNNPQDADLEPIKEKDIYRQEDHGVEKAKNMAKSMKMAHKEVDSDLSKSWKK